MQKATTTRPRSQATLAPLVLGRVYHHERSMIYITGGCYEAKGRISNHWTWRRVLSNGLLSKQEGAGYIGPLLPLANVDIVIKVTKRK